MLGAWEAFAEDCAEDFDFEIGNKGGNLFNCFGAPSVGTDDGGILEFGAECVGEVRGGEDSWVWTNMDGGSSYDNRGGIDG